MKNEEMEKLFNQSVRLFLKNHLETLNQDLQANNRSFVYLENNMLQMMMTYLFMNMDNKAESRHNQVDMEKLEQIESDLDAIIDENKNEFEAIFDLLDRE
ncbi:MULTISPECIES: hypothetical protein [Clostridia]|uniref:hypothetical protein n=1 Tax=Clostridia TaxID=186801 RepID=UPI000EA1D8E2|nr:MULTISPECIES: hypothetical protein [Clostridia]NBJ71656.1 hypothetical protein [Roseburia sp. 1XD42-34]RKI73939.1 hypothetical protein D7V87_19720 [Clostridium sp. 1xD42-85]